MTELTPTAQVQHTPDCPGPAIVRREGTHRALLTCTACQQSVSVPRRSEWRDNGQEAR